MIKRTPPLSLFIAGFLQSTAYGGSFLLAFCLADAGHPDLTARILFLATCGTLLAVPAGGHLADRLGLGRAAALGGAMLALGCAILALTLWLAPNQRFVLTLAGLPLGIGWGWCYTVTPMLLSALVTDEQRVAQFSYFSACVMAGIGCGPIIGRALLPTLGASGLFAMAALAAAIAGGLLSRLHPPLDHVRLPARLTGQGVRAVLAGEMRWPVVMVFLGASCFSVMANFQDRFAADRGLNPDFYFAAYTIAVIAGRFALGGWSGRQPPYAMAGTTLLIMTLALIGFGMLGNVVPIYLIIAAAFGIGYGLTYPVIKALAVNLSPHAHRDHTLLMFSLAYFLGIFGFPALAAPIIHSFGLMPILLSAMVLATLETSLAWWRWYHARRSRAIEKAPEAA